MFSVSRAVTCVKYPNTCELWEELLYFMLITLKTEKLLLKLLLSILAFKVREARCCSLCDTDNFPSRIKDL